MKIAVIGAGFAGLAVAWEGQLKGDEVTVFDRQGIGSGASGVAAGLCHPFTGSRAKLHKEGREGMEAARELFEVAQKETDKPLFKEGIIRIALNPEQEIAFSSVADQHPDVTLWSKDRIEKELPGAAPNRAIFIQSGLTVQTYHYLQALWKACRRAGIQLVEEEIKHLRALKFYDRVIVTAGMETKNFPETSHLPLVPRKGQILHLRWPKGLPPLPYTLNASIYIVMSEDLQSCFVGGTFERSFKDGKVDLEAAKEYLFPRLEKVIPELTKSEILGCRSGIRATTPHHQPIVEKINDRYFVVTALGSKGLLYHALLAKKLYTLL